MVSLAQEMDRQEASVFNPVVNFFEDLFKQMGEMYGKSDYLEEGEEIDDEVGPDEIIEDDMEDVVDDI